MEGFDRSTYGDAFADVYDRWYADLGDLDACVDVIAELAGDTAVLELGVGTGRVAGPLTRRGVPVVGLDASRAMLARLAGAHPAVRPVLGDAAVLPLAASSIGVVFAAYNTFWSLGDAAAQRACLRESARCLAPGGLLALEGIVAPTDPERPSSSVEVSRLSLDAVVLLASKEDAEAQEIAGQHVQITEAGIRLRPWRIRYHTHDQLDALAAGAGLDLVDRWGGWHRAALEPGDPVSVSLYRRR